VSFIDSRELRFLLYEWLGVEALTHHPLHADHSRDTFDAVLELAERLADDKFATHYKKADRVVPVLENGQVRVIPEIRDALSAYAEAGLFAASFAAEHGGLGLPHVIEMAAMAHFMAANIATAAYPMLTVANARVLVRFGTEAQITRYALPQIEGRWLGTMCLSEPQAGSSLADITIRAVHEAEDDQGPRYRLTGNKMWISGGDHDLTENIVHLVLAKIPDDQGKLTPGTVGISLFVVPKFLVAPSGALESNDIEVAGLNHKMGYRGTTNCLLNFGEGTRHAPFGLPGAIGYRVGGAGQGLPIMFQMMNEARLSVGLGAAALACRGYRQSLAYARQRTQGRASAQDKSSPQTPIIAHADVKRMLLVQKSHAEGALALVLYCAKLVDDEALEDEPAAKARLSSLLGLLTPVAKSWPAEFGLMANDLAIQIHGGYGYTSDFDVEQLYRDNRLNPIHEGTHGIQAIDLLGRKILRDRSGALDILEERLMATASRAGDITMLQPLADQLIGIWGLTRDVARRLATAGDAVGALDNASLFLSSFGHVVVAWLWLDQIVALAKAPAYAGPFGEGKSRACQLFFDLELPKAGYQLGFVASLNNVASGMPSDAF
jgi:alkylation response protein AidB-like acyl-CoA dehydrogenase